MDDRSRGAPEVARIAAELDERGYCVIPAVISTAEADNPSELVCQLMGANRHRPGLVGTGQ